MIGAMISNGVALITIISQRKTNFLLEWSRIIGPKIIGELGRRIGDSTFSTQVLHFGLSMTAELDKLMTMME
jgi:hypothetical protein